MTGQGTFFDSFQSGMVTVSESGQEVFLIVFRLDFDSLDRTPLRGRKFLRFQVLKCKKSKSFKNGKNRALRAPGRHKSIQ